MPSLSSAVVGAGHRLRSSVTNRWAALAIVVASGCAPADCPKGSVRNSDDGLCYLYGDAGSGDEDGVDDGGAAGGDEAGGPGDGDGSAGDGAGGGSAGDDSGGDEGGVEPTIADSCEPPDRLPADPLEKLGELDLQSMIFAEAVDIELDPDRGIAVLAGHGGLMLVDISDPGNPSWQSSDTPERYEGRFQNLELGQDGTVYATHWDHGMAVYDLTVSPPERLADIEREGAAGMARVDDSLLMVDKKAARLVVYDVSVPARPRFVTEVEGLSAPFAPFVLGDRAYVADNTEGIVIYDISTPASPAWLGAVETGASVQDLAFSADGRTMYAAAGGAGVQVWSLDDPDVPILLDTLPLAYSVLSVAVGDGLLWAVDQQDVVAIDVSTPRAPLVLNARQTGQWSMHVAASGREAWVADWAWIRGFTASGDAVGDLDPATTTLYLDPDGGSLELALANLGGADVTLSGIQASDERVSWSSSDVVVAPRQSASLTLSWEGGEPFESTLCIASDDPDAPVQEVALVSTAEGGRAGIGAMAPDFELEDLDGNLLRLSDQRGRPVVLAYFATW